jgi:hypothetical protein
MSHVAPTKCKRCAKGFSSSRSRQQHIRDALQHKRTVEVVQRHEEIYVGIPASEVNKIFNAAVRLRFAKPDVSTLIQITSTKVQPEIVSAIREGALRLLPPDNTIDGQRVRKEIAAEKARHSAAAELNFVTYIRSVGFTFMDEAEQKQRIKEALDNGLQPIRSTPDILFAQPVHLQGKQCRWIEYKNTFGFKKNPFVHSKQRKQLTRYVEQFGAGIVVYKLGFEQNLLNMGGVSIVREVEVFAWFQKQR